MNTVVAITFTYSMSPPPDIGPMIPVTPSVLVCCKVELNRQIVHNIQLGISPDLLQLKVISECQFFSGTQQYSRNFYAVENVGYVEKMFKSGYWILRLSSQFIEEKDRIPQPQNSDFTFVFSELKSTAWPILRHSPNLSCEDGYILTSIHMCSS